MKDRWRNFNFWFWPLLLWPLFYGLGEVSNEFALFGFIGQIVSLIVLAIVFAYYASKFGHKSLVTISMLFVPVISKIVGSIIGSHIQVTASSYYTSFPLLVLPELIVLFAGYGIIYFLYSKNLRKE